MSYQSLAVPALESTGIHEPLHMWLGEDKAIAFSSSPYRRSLVLLAAG